MASASAPISERDAVRRLLQRMGLGPRPGELASAAAAGFDATLEALIGPPHSSDAGVAATPPPAFGPANTAGTTQAAARRAQRQVAGEQSRQAVTWWLNRMVAADRPFPERMTWFWHGHFATSVRKVGSAALMLDQNETQRRLGTGDFRQLAQAMIVDPAMLVWLDGSGSRAAHPNENLSREFMELFTLGVGNYSENDVRAAARALTGWRVNFLTDTSGPAPANHDPGPETVLGTAAAFDAASFVDLLLSRPASPRFIACRIWTRFVAAAPPDAATLDALVQAYGSDHDITGLMRAVVASAAFRAPASVLVRQPVEWLVAALRALKLPASKINPAALNAALAAMGQIPFAPPSVGGWPSGPAWLTSSAALAKIQISAVLAAAGDLSPVTDAPAAGRVAATAELLGLPPFTQRTANALALLISHPPQLVAAALASPESWVSA